MIRSGVLRGRLGRKSRSIERVLLASVSTISSITVISPTALASLPGLVAVLAIHRTIASRLKRHRCLLSAIGTGHRRSLRIVLLILPRSRLVSPLRLTTRFAALRGRIATILEEFLIPACECEFLPAIDTG